MTVDRRFRGPATSGNGGYTAGLLAQHLTAVGSGDVVRVRLRTPPPLDMSLSVNVAAGVAVARHGETVVAEAEVVPSALEAVPPVPYEVAVAACASYAGLQAHPFPECFVCGPARDVGDGMRLFPGRAGEGRTACAWRPDIGVVPPELVWAALDCPGGWTAGIEGRPMVLGTMTARVDAVPDVGEECVVTGALRSAEGRRAETATSLYGSDGRALAHAYAVWVQIDAAAFNRIFAPS